MDEADEAEIFKIAPYVSQKNSCPNRIQAIIKLFMKQEALRMQRDRKTCNNN